VYRAFECLPWADNQCTTLGPDTLLITLKFDDLRQWSAAIVSNNILSSANHKKAAAKSNEYFFERTSRGCATCFNRRADKEQCPVCSLRGSAARVLGMFEPPLKVDRHIKGHE
jgi:hypothetical protein